MSPWSAPLPTIPLPRGIASRFVETETGLKMHVLESGARDRPLLLLLHGFPELAFSWRRVMPALAEGGYWVVAPDQRGYGRTTGWDGAYDSDLKAFSMPSLVRDQVALVRALGRDHVHAVIGHDFGSPVAAWSALLNPEIFRRAALMSAPFGGPPEIAVPTGDVHADLAALARPRKHYQWYYSTREAARDMEHPPQGLRAFLRAYFHVKSAHWPGNRPRKLTGWTAAELAKLPTYYVMDLAEDMPTTVAPHMPSAAQIAACQWLPEGPLTFYTGEFARTGFQGGLNWYRCATGPAYRRELAAHAGKAIEVPVTFLAGTADWGTRQVPGALEAMEATACADYRGTHLIEGAGHWVQQEQPRAVAEKVLAFLL